MAIDRKVILFLLCLVFFSPFKAYAVEKDSRVMVFQGGGASIAMFLGMLAAFEDHGRPPDLIIGSCGGSIAAVIAHVFDSRRERMNIVRSKQFYNLIKNITPHENYETLTQGLRLIGKLYSKYKIRQKIPDIWNEYLFDIPQDLDIDLPMDVFTDKRPRIVIIAGKAIYNEEDVHQKRKGGKLFQQVLFTDSATAKSLRKFISPLSQIQNSTVLAEVDVITDVGLRDAARASIADSFYLSPKEIKGEWFVAGTIDLFPLELARTLADEVAMNKRSSFSWFAKGMFWASYNIDINERRHKVFNSTIDYLIDTERIPGHLHFMHWPNWSEWEIESRLPSNYNAYVTRVAQQFRFGYNRASMAIWNNRDTDLLGETRIPSNQSPEILFNFLYSERMKKSDFLTEDNRPLHSTVNNRN
ncbi:MAG: patatin-like phospholipase family protein [Halobacteriovoraceae bacterium]|nr:patatin-like phospholipase family protein [Halobacteriovoraceae bacterium]